jgi:hypothetical protein
MNSLRRLPMNETHSGLLAQFRDGIKYTPRSFTVAGAAPALRT